MVRGRSLSMIGVAAVLATTFGLAGCQRPNETPKSEEVSRIISAMGHVRTFRLTSTVTDNYTVVQKKARSTETWLWEGQATIDMAKNAAYVSMNATDLVDPEVTLYRWEQYVVRAWRYYNQTTPGAGGMRNPWTRTKLNGQDPVFSNSAQVTAQMELLKTAEKVNLAGYEAVDGLNCDVIEVSPTAGAAADWVLSQDRGGSGPSVGWWRTGPERSKEIYVNAYTGSSAKFWIDQQSSRVVKVDVDLHFVVQPGNAKRSDMGVIIDATSNEADLGFDEIARDFRGELHFSGYGQALSIAPPTEALEAPTH